MTKKTALKWESGAVPSRFFVRGERRFKALSEAHGIPIHWLMSMDLFDVRFKAIKEAAEEKAIAQPQAEAAS